MFCNGAQGSSYTVLALGVMWHRPHLMSASQALRSSCKLSSSFEMSHKVAWCAWLLLQPTAATWSLSLPMTDAHNIRGSGPS